jgi:hypothetical protein
MGISDAAAGTFLDSGCSTTILNDLSVFTGTLSSDAESIDGIAGTLRADGVGPASIYGVINGVSTEIRLPRALLIASAPANLISKGQLKRLGYSFKDGTLCEYIQFKGKTIAKLALTDNNLYAFRICWCKFSEVFIIC